MNFLYKICDNIWESREFYGVSSSHPPSLSFFFFRSKGHFSCIWGNGLVLQIKGDINKIKYLA